jgi:hypothetical protein
MNCQCNTPWLPTPAYAEQLKQGNEQHNRETRCDTQDQRQRKDQRQLPGLMFPKQLKGLYYKKIRLH